MRTSGLTYKRSASEKCFFILKNSYTCPPLQLISWLRPISEHDENDNSLLSITVRSATAWCDGYTVPLLVPLTGWLPATLPSQIRVMTVTGTGQVRDVCVSSSKQHLILATKSDDVQLWHIMSNSLEHIFKGE